MTDSFILSYTYCIQIHFSFLRFKLFTSVCVHIIRYLYYFVRLGRSVQQRYRLQITGLNWDLPYLPNRYLTMFSDKRLSVLSFHMQVDNIIKTYDDTAAMWHWKYAILSSASHTAHPRDKMAEARLCVTISAYHRVLHQSILQLN